MLHLRMRLNPVSLHSAITLARSTLTFGHAALEAKQLKFEAVSTRLDSLEARSKAITVHFMPCLHVNLQVL